MTAREFEKQMHLLTVITDAMSQLREMELLNLDNKIISDRKNEILRLRKAWDGQIMKAVKSDPEYVRSVCGIETTLFREWIENSQASPSFP